MTVFQLPHVIEFRDSLNGEDREMVDAFVNAEQNRIEKLNAWIVQHNIDPVNFLQSVADGLRETSSTEKQGETDRHNRYVDIKKKAKQLLELIEDTRYMGFFARSLDQLQYLASELNDDTELNISRSMSQPHMLLQTKRAGSAHERTKLLYYLYRNYLEFAFTPSVFGECWGVVSGGEDVDESQTRREIRELRGG